MIREEEKINRVRARGEEKSLFTCLESVCGVLQLGLQPGATRFRVIQLGADAALVLPCESRVGARPGAPRSMLRLNARRRIKTPEVTGDWEAAQLQRAIDAASHPTKKKQLRVGAAHLHGARLRLMEGALCVSELSLYLAKRLASST